MKRDVKLSKCDPTLSGREYRLESPIYAKELRFLVDVYTQKLERKGAPSSYNDVLELMSWFLEIPRADLQAKIAQKTPIKEVFSTDGAVGGFARAISQMDHLIDERAKRIPLQHITHTAHFFGLELEVGKGVFTPRPETEVLVSHCLQLVGEMQCESPKILDLCAGSGAITLALAVNLENADITAVEKSADAYAYLERNVVAHENAFLSGTKVQTMQADVLVALKKMPQKYHLIACNPPYVPLAQKNDLSPEVRRDPALALFGDDANSSDGFALPARIIAASVGHLEEAGAMIVEHAEHQSPLAKVAFEEAGKACGVRFSDIYHLDDLNSRPRFTVAKVAHSKHT